MIAQRFDVERRCRSNVILGRRVKSLQQAGKHSPPVDLRAMDRTIQKARADVVCHPTRSHVLAEVVDRQVLCDLKLEFDWHGSRITVQGRRACRDHRAQVRWVRRVREGRESTQCPVDLVSHRWDSVHHKHRQHIPALVTRVSGRRKKRHTGIEGEDRTYRRPFSHVLPAYKYRHDTSAEPQHVPSCATMERRAQQ